ncbi:longitudinals lacking protein, isoforms H/M/V isoform X28 [Hyalella azteca]|uniref:Longitudinals lacking protein, isoforms H/M/V isoform X28 n=1 Tax=Hyalella azteca TaxID=294128 RepID=A0A979FWU0_HYAAZ|nr:longitudinals lacking protein, isoforms H/M/V isoform X28 [Hyalella azteca]
MSSGLLSLKWNNHRSTFFHVLSTIRSKESYCDVTLACDGRFYSLHKFVLSTCSEYFEEMFERTQCKHPVIVLKDINSEDLEALLNYMYVGEVNVVQEKLAGLIKAAECLKIKGLAVPDEDPMESKDNSSIGREQHKRSQRGEDSPRAKRRRRENSSDVSEEILSPVRSRPSGRSRDHHHHHHHHGSHNAKSAPVAPSGDNEDGTRETQGLTDASEEAENSSINANRQTDSSSNKTNSAQSSSHKKEVVPEEVTLDDDNVKSEPLDLDNEDTGDDDMDNKDGLHHDLGFDGSDTMGGADDDGNYVDVDPSMLGQGQPQSVEDVVAQAMPGSSGFQGNSFPLWEGDGSLSGFPSEGFSGDSSQARQMVASPLEPLLNTPVLEGNSDYSSFARSDGDDREKECSLCSYRTSFSSNLRQHYMTHSGERPYACSYCSYRCSKKSNLQKHLFIHTGEKPFKCSICDYRARQKVSVQRHIATKHTSHADILESA